MAALAVSGNILPVCPCLAVKDVDCGLRLSGIGGMFPGLPAVIPAGGHQGAGMSVEDMSAMVW